MRILVANPFGIGDTLFSLPLVRALRQAHPDGFLGYLCNRRTAELVGGWPELDWRRVFEKDEFRQAWASSKRKGLAICSELVGEVRRQRFDLFLDLSLGWHYGLAAALARIPRRVGFDFRNRGRFLTDRIPVAGFHVQPVAEYYLDLLPPAGIPKPSRPDGRLSIPAEIEPAVDRYLSGQGISNSARWVAIAPGGGASWGPNAALKQWPASFFAQVADSIARRHGARVLLVGDSQDAELCERVCRAASCRPRMALEVPSLWILAGLLRRSALAMGNDGGILHLAAAAGARTVSIFGPVDASVYGPYPRRPIHRVVSKGLACRPCYQRFRLPPCPWDNRCLKELPIEPVLEAADELLA